MYFAPGNYCWYDSEHFGALAWRSRRLASGQSFLAAVLLLCGIGAIVAGLLAPNSKRHFDRMTEATVEAKAIEQHLAFHHAGRAAAYTSWAYFPLVKVSYSVAGRAFVRDVPVQYDCGERSFSSAQAAKKALARYEVGQRLRVFYQQARPDSVKLTPDPRLRSQVEDYCAGGLSLLGGIALLIYMRRSARL